jgi:hypothetical protein
VSNIKARDMGIELLGDRNQCAGCGTLFNSSHAFDKHRVGAHGIDRRCRTDAEMLEAGMLKRADGFWVGSAMPEIMRVA